MIELGIKYRGDEEIIRYADNFLQKYHKSNSIPVPIEEIIDFQFDIDIVPLPGIQKLCDVEGFITPDFRAIYVDEGVYQDRPYRFRFTLAHEIGHLFMHKKELSKVKLDPTSVINSWATFVAELDSRDHSKMEYQGYTFGGLVLVPQSHLSKQFDLHYQEVLPLIEEAKEKGVSRQGYLEYAIDQMAVILSPIFDMSTDVLTRRITNDKLEQQFP